MTPSPDQIVKSAYAVIRLAIAARGCEVETMTTSDVLKGDFEGSSSKCYKVRATKKKRVTCQATDWERENCALIEGANEVAVIDRFLACFSAEELAAENCRLFRKLKQLNNGKIVITQQLIGKNTLPKYGVDIARTLGLENPHRYTGHCFKRSGVTWGADSGMSEAQLMAYSGHRSSTSMHGYIQRSSLQSHRASRAISTSSSGMNQYNMQQNNTSTVNTVNSQTTINQQVTNSPQTTTSTTTSNPFINVTGGSSSFVINYYSASPSHFIPHQPPAVPPPVAPPVYQYPPPVYQYPTPVAPPQHPPAAYQHALPAIAPPQHPPAAYQHALPAIAPPCQQPAPILTLDAPLTPPTTPPLPIFQTPGLPTPPPLLQLPAPDQTPAPVPPLLELPAPDPTPAPVPKKKQQKRTSKSNRESGPRQQSSSNPYSFQYSTSATNRSLKSKKHKR